MPINGSDDYIATVKIRITGLVQGVGFRPFIYGLASEHGLTGEVENRNDGVFIVATGTAKQLELFRTDIEKRAPIASVIDLITVEAIPIQNFKEFSIVPSKNLSNHITEISPDIATCQNCLNDLKNQLHRRNYPFINCTHCGPRFTIIKELPYDRPNTTMAEFQLCQICEQEYKDVLDRRFHAQPVACNHCGPCYTMWKNNSKTDDFSLILKELSTQIELGEVTAIKGLGGFHLMCDAYNEVAIQKLRDIKLRESKPFAVMCRDLDSVKRIAFTNTTEESSLTSWRRPIVLLKSKNIVTHGVSNRLNQIGVMLPYLPLHYLMFEQLKTNCVVLTSGNISDEPIIIDNEFSKKVFGDISAAVITNNREIYNRCDDSVAIVVNSTESVIRRSRGYAPSPIKTSCNVEGIFGAGSELVNCFALGKEKQIILSQHIGDIKNAETFEFYRETFERFSRLFKFKPELVVHDLHPNYLSTVFAKELAVKFDIPVISVQHHHAHIASCMAEHKLDEDVIGVSMDGVGLGTDGQIWGGEFFIGNLESFKRVNHFEYIPISGADRLPYEPWRSAFAYLKHYFGDAYQSVLKGIPEKDIVLYNQLIDKRINTWSYSSAGRLFDAVSALLGVCTHAGFHAEAPMRLESIADDRVSKIYPFDVTNEVISLKQTFEALLKDLEMGTETSTIAGAFHNTVVQLIYEATRELSVSSGINKIVLSGGTFQNKILLEKLVKLYSKSNLQLYYQQRVPSNDGGIALGQILIGGKKRENGMLELERSGNRRSQ